MPEGRQTGRLWSINGRFLTRDMTGVDRYAWEILRSIDELIQEAHPLTEGTRLELLCPAGNIEESPFPNIPRRFLPNAPGHIWEQIILPRFVEGGLLSMCNTGPVSIARQIICIHDVNTRLAPRSYSFAFRAAYRLFQPLLARRAARTVTVSYYSKREMEKRGFKAPHDIEVIHDGYEHALKWRPDRSTLRNVNLPRPFVFLLGSKAAHKNAGVIAAIATELAAKGIHIVATGGEDSNVYAHDDSLPSLGNLRHLGRVSDDDLAYLYREALCLVFPSKAEGFGLPALEAMALGCPVVSSDAASLPEVCGQAAIFVSPDDKAAWLDAILRLAGDPVLRDRLAAAGPPRSRLFSWRASALKYLELIAKVDLA